jgi:hypothetical protein
MVCFQTKNPNFGKIWYVCGHLLYFFRFGMFGPKKSGNPAEERQSRQAEPIQTHSVKIDIFRGFRKE